MTVAEIRKAIEHLPDEALVVPFFHNDPSVHSARLMGFDPDQAKNILFIGIQIYMIREDEEDDDE